MDAVQTKQIMRQSLFIWTSVTQKHKMPLSTPGMDCLLCLCGVFQEEQKSMCNPFRHEWNLKSMEHYKYFTRYEYCYSARLIKSYSKDIYNIIK